MGLLDSVEKLITEHGSAAILRERIALANDKHAALERKATTLEAENGELRTQLKVALAYQEQLRTELNSLKESIANASSAGSSSRLEELREKILALLATNDGATDQQIAGVLGVSQPVAEFHLQELPPAQMIRCTLRVGQRVTPWHLSQEGRRYLVVNKLVAYEAPTAGHQAQSGGTRYIFASPGLASCRRRPLSSNVRPQNQTPIASDAAQSGHASCSRRRDFNRVLLRPGSATHRQSFAALRPI